MNWKIENNVKRIFGVFKRSKTPIYPEDIEALKSVSGVLEEMGKVNMNDNLLFAKLLCYVINNNLHHYGNISHSISSVATVFKKPITHHIEILAHNLNAHELNDYLKSIGINFDNLKDQPEIVKANEKEIIEKIKSNWCVLKVEKSFVKTVNEFLTDIDNYI